MDAAEAAIDRRFNRADDQRARRAAKRIGLAARKSRKRRSIDNHGGFRIIEPYNNIVEAGERFDLSPEDVIEFCRPTLKAFL
jgi:hypothetical protein